MARTFYDLMMLSPYADRDLITVVYRHLAKRYHPDKDPSPEAEARMMELNEAYAILSDRSKRSRYDEIMGLAVGETGDAASRNNDASSAAEPFGEAGPPPVNPLASGSVLIFGRYRGWSLNQVERYDRDYIEWLSRTTVGRSYRLELERLLQRRG
ncbi:MAG: DnaJ domain-containing protein [Chloroflexota bacterium]